MSNISGQLIKDSFNYVLQSDLISGIVYRIGGSIAENPKFISGLTVNANFTYSDGSEFPGFVLTCDAAGNAVWAPVSGATSGVVVTGGTFDYSAGTLTLVLSNGVDVPISGLQDIYVTGGTVSGTSIVFSYNDTNTFQVTGITPYNVFSSYTASTQVTINNKLDTSGFTAYTASTQSTINNKLDTSGFTAYTATTQPLILNAITGGTYSNGVLNLINNSGTTIPISGFTTGGTSTTDSYVTGFTLDNNTILLSQNRIDQYSAFNISLSGYVTNNIFTSYTASTEQTISSKVDETTFDQFAQDTNIALNNRVEIPTFTAYTATTQQLILNSVTGGTYSGGTLYLVNNSGTTIPISGFTTGGTSTTDSYVTGFSLNNETITLSQNRVDQYSAFNISLSGYVTNNIFSSYTASTQSTINNKLDISGFTAYTAYTETTINNKLDISGFTAYTASTQPLILNSVTGGTFSGGTLYLINNSGTTIPISGFTTGGTSTTDTFVTGFTLSANTITLSQNRTDSYSSFTISLSAYTGSSVSGAYLPLSGGTLTGGLVANSGLTANTISQTSYIDFTTGTTNPSSVAGRVFFDSTQKALSYFDITNDQVPIAMGQQLYTRVWNATGTQIDKGKVIAITGTTNNLPSAILARNVHTSGFDRPIGLAAENIPNGSEGLVLNNGILSGITLNTFTNGDTLYLSDTVPGGYVSSTSSLAFTARTNEIGYVLQTGSTTGKIYVNINNEDSNLSLTDKERNILEGNVISSGVYEYTGITQGTGNTINVAYARGWIVKNTYEFATLPDVINLYYSGGTNIPLTFLNSADATFILINSASTLVQQTTYPTPQQRRENIFLGKVVHPNRTSITSINQTVDFDVSPMAALRDLWTPLKLINQGILVSANGANLNINVSSGTLWGNGIGWTTNQLNPDSVVLSGQSPTTFQYRTRLGPITGGTVPTGNTTTIYPGYYDNNGVVTAVGGGSNSSTNQRVFIFPTGLVRIQLGQVVYGTLAAAIAGSQTESFTEYSLNRENGILIGIISVNKNATNLSDTNQAVFDLVSKFGEIMGGTGGLSTTTLQQAYDNSSSPAEIVTNATLGALHIKNGTGNPDNVSTIFQTLNAAGTSTAFIRADGVFSGTSIYGTGLTALTISATTYLNLPSATFTGGTVSGPTNFTSGLTANTISATTFSGNGSGLTNVQNIYNSDGTISSDRYVNISGNTLWFSGLANGFQVIINDGITKPGFTILSDSLGGPSFSVTYDGSIIIDGPAEFYNTTQFDSTVSIINLSPDNTSPYLLGLNSSNEVATFDSSLLLNAITGGTYSGTSLYLVTNSGNTIEISGFTKSGGTLSFTGGTVTGPTNFTGGLTANTISATTYQNLPSFTGGTVSGATRFISGLTANTISATTYQNLPATPFLPLTGGTITGNVTVNAPVSTNTKSILSTSKNTSESIALYGLAGRGTNAYGVYCDVSPSDGAYSITNGIGGYFEVGQQFGNGEPTNKYSLQLKDGTEGLNKVLTSVTSDGKSNWSDTINVSAVTATTITSNSVKVLPVALTVISNTATTNASLSSLFTLTLTGNTTLATPTNGFSGQRILYQLKQDGTGNKLLTLSSGFRSGPITVTLSTAANTTDYLGVIYNAIDNRWDVLALNKGYS